MLDNLIQPLHAMFDWDIEEPVIKVKQEVKTEPPEQKVRTAGPSKPVREKDIKWKKFLIDAGDPNSGHWPVIEDTGMLGCKVCRKHGQKGPWADAKVTTVKNMDRHQQTEAHLKAVADHLGKPFYDDNIGAPSVAVFESVLLSKVKATSDRKAATREAGPEKVARMVWCMAESYKMYERKFFESDIVMAIYQDARQGILALEYVAVRKSDLEVRRGMLGLAEDYGPRARIRLRKGAGEGEEGRRGWRRKGKNTCRHHGYADSQGDAKDAARGSDVRDWVPTRREDSEGVQRHLP